MEKNKIINGDCLEVLKTLPDNSIDCCVTSPPYYALRDYGTATWMGGDSNCPHYRTSKASDKTATGHKRMQESGSPVGDAIYKDVCPLCGAKRVDKQIGLEETPEKYIEKMTEVFMEVYRVLKTEGTLWLNIGDSYWGGGWRNAEFNEHSGDLQKGSKGTYCGKTMPACKGVQGVYKPKDLIGIPWALATSLRNSFYKGKIKKESDRRWLAAIVDGEGCITGTIHTRKDGTGNRTSVFANVTNSNIDLLNECERIYPFGKRLIHQKNGKGHLGERDIFRWNIFGNEAKKDLFQELYPYLISKKTQCLLAYNFCLIQETSKKDGHTPKRVEVNKKRELLISLISLLNKGEKVEIPDWCIEPPTLYTQGWYLRQDIIWGKGNPMPESVTDRCTKSHEYVFLFSKSPKYYFDYEAIQEPAVTQGDVGKIKFGGNKYGENNDSHFDTYSGNEWKPQTKNCQYDGQKPNTMHLRREAGLQDKEYNVRNKRDVWSVNVKPCKEAHFATYPPELIKPCILAGCPIDGIVLDPFMWSGTTALVAKANERNYIGIELNKEYIEIANKRLYNHFGMFL